MGAAGCVAWMFHKRGVIRLDKGAADEDRVMELALDAGADDVSDATDCWEIVTAPETFEAVKAALDSAKIARASAEVTMVPENTVSLTGKDAEHTLKLLDDLEEHDDIQNVASNVDIPQEELERLSAA
ncbi:MAG: putative transcriptional regulatory protein [Deltaproteobacteria bacterium]|nr:putative transcriptional regulatory protein [Deltaproteobacteria bacterium]